ncbi:MAG: exonuclease domain-containing protein, partial [Gammaproteobacteria bacterium]|nr:exonuclease domain-containing protein [Gammaproteobacteria bacterium]
MGSKRGIADRFRGFLPVIIDVETAGFNHKKDALLEVAAVILRLNDDGILKKKESIAVH